MPPSEVEKVGGKLFVFGSYRLNVHTRGMYSYADVVIVYLPLVMLT